MANEYYRPGDSFEPTEIEQIIMGKHSMIVQKQIKDMCKELVDIKSKEPEIMSMAAQVLLHNVASLISLCVFYAHKNKPACTVDDAQREAIICLGKQLTHEWNMSLEENRRVFKINKEEEDETD